MSGYSSSDDEEVKPRSVVQTTNDVSRDAVRSGQQNGGVSPLLIGAGIVGAVGILVGVGARFLFKSKKNASSSGVTEKDEKRKNRARMVPGPRKVPPRRPRSVASSDVGSQTKRCG